MGNPVTLNSGAVADLENLDASTPIVAEAKVPVVQTDVSLDEARTLVAGSSAPYAGINGFGSSPATSLIPMADGAEVPAAPANETPKVGVTSTSGTYKDGVYNGTIKGIMHVPNPDKAMKVLSGEDVASFKKFPLMIKEMVKYEGGILTYGLDSDSSFARNLGYRLKTTATKQEDGTIKVSWTNADPQPKKNPGGDSLLNFKKNNGSWTLTPIKDNPGYYNVTWTTHTEVDEDTLQFGAGLVPDSKVTKETNVNTKKNFEGGVKILGAL